MTGNRLDRIRNCIRHRHYYMSAHAMEEMAEDLLDIVDVEAAILSGTINRMEKGDPRGTKYVVKGLLTTSGRPLA
jgi:fructose-specific phosphotransferase system component IIB